MLTVAILLLGGLSPDYQSSKIVSIKNNNKKLCCLCDAGFFVYELQ